MALTEVNSLGIKDLEVKTGDIAADAVTGAKIADDQINSEHYVAASIDHEHLANDCVDGDNIADDSIGAEHIADNAVGLAAMAHGTDGKVFTYDASGAPTTVGPGTDGQVLTSTGAGSAPAFEDIPASGTPTNLLNNGAMQVAQRQTSLTMAHDGTTSGFGVDRWALQMHNADEFDGTLAQVGDDPTGEFTKCLKWTTGTAESAIAADEYVMIRQHIESQNLQHLRWGTGSAKQLTLQFWVKSSVTGTYGCSFYSGRSSGTRVINTTYAISSANTWEQKTITIAADTGGSVLANDNEAGLSIIFPLAAGSNYDGTNSTSWADYSTANYLGGHAQDGVVTTASATWQITGVQLETGNSAGTFNHRSYAEELLDCQRYCQQIVLGIDSATTYFGGAGSWYAASAAYQPINFGVFMRTGPTVTWSTGTNHFTLTHNGTNDGTSNPAAAYGNWAGGTTLYYQGGSNSLSNGTAGHSFIASAGSASSWITASAEI